MGSVGRHCECAADGERKKEEEKKRRLTNSQLFGGIGSLMIGSWLLIDPAFELIANQPSWVAYAAIVNGCLNAILGFIGVHALWGRSLNSASSFLAGLFVSFFFGGGVAIYVLASAVGELRDKPQCKSGDPICSSQAPLKVSLKKESVHCLLCLF